MGVKIIKEKDINGSSNTNKPDIELRYNVKTGNALHVKNQVVTSSDKTVFYIVMRAVDGDLFDLVASMEEENKFKEGMTAKKFVKMLYSIIEEYVKRIYSKNIVHKDLKLENIFYRKLPSGRFKIYIGDFGFATESDTSSLKSSGSLPTIAYELFYLDSEDAYKNTSKLDFYSVGMLLRMALGYWGNFVNPETLETCEDSFSEKVSENISRSPFVRVELNNKAAVDYLIKASEAVTKHKPEERNMKKLIEYLTKALMAILPEEKIFYLNKQKELLNILTPSEENSEEELIIEDYDSTEKTILWKKFNDGVVEIIKNVIHNKIVSYKNTLVKEDENLKSFHKEIKNFQLGKSKDENISESEVIKFHNIITNYQKKLTSDDNHAVYIKEFLNNFLRRIQMLFRLTRATPKHAAFFTRRKMTEKLKEFSKEKITSGAGFPNCKF